MYLPIEALRERYTTTLQTLSEIAQAYYFQGKLDDAFRFWQTSEQILGASEIRPIDQLQFLLRYGDFLTHYYFLTNREEALMLSIVQRAHQEAETLHDQSGIATALFLLGKTLYNHQLQTGSSDYSEAHAYFQQSSALREQIGDTYELAESLFYIGLTHDRQQQFDQAKAYYQHALELAEQQRNKWAASEATRHLTDHTEGEQRLHYALRSLELRNKMHYQRALPSAQLLLSDIYIERGDLELALEYCQQAERLSSEMGLQNYLVFALLTRGEIAHQQGKLTEAREHFIKALALAQHINIAYAITAAREKLQALDTVVAEPQEEA